RRKRLEPRTTLARSLARRLRLAQGVSDQLLLAGLEKAARCHRRGGQQVEDRPDADGSMKAEPKAIHVGAAAESTDQQPKGQERDECADARAGPAERFLAQAVG